MIPQKRYINLRVTTENYNLAFLGKFSPIIHKKYCFFFFSKIGERFHDVAVEVTNSSKYEQRGFYKGPAKTKEVVDILCDYPTIARYVRLKIKKGTVNSLNVPELEIYTA